MREDSGELGRRQRTGGGSAGRLSVGGFIRGRLPERMDWIWP